MELTARAVITAANAGRAITYWGSLTELHGLIRPDAGAQSPASAPRHQFNAP